MTRPGPEEYGFPRHPGGQAAHAIGDLVSIVKGDPKKERVLADWIRRHVVVRHATVALDKTVVLSACDSKLYAAMEVRRVRDRLLNELPVEVQTADTDGYIEEHVLTVVTIA